MEKQAAYYQNIAEITGQKRLREVEQLNRLISERKRAEEALIQAQRLSAIGELASGVAHDFNNSLQGIFGNIDLALLKDISPEVKDYLETIKKSAIDAASRIHQLQRFSGKCESLSGHDRLDLNSIVEEAILQTRPLWKDESEKAGITIAIEKKFAAKELIVNGNPGELRSVLYNMIKNSVHAMPEGGKMAFETGETEKGVFLTVTDTGTGMDEKTKARVFEPFFTTKGFGQGKGLGLSISYAIIKEHGGRTYVKESVLNIGTSIEIVLPYPKRKRNSLQGAVSGYAASASVLWVDDEEMIRNIGKEMLEALAHRADVAASGVEALSLLRNNQYDLLITDIGMPDMNGWQLVERIKENYPEMKVAVVTGWGAEVSNEEKEKYGVDKVLGKPIDIMQLKHMVGEVLREG